MALGNADLYYLEAEHKHIGGCIAPTKSNKKLILPLLGDVEGFD